MASARRTHTLPFSMFQESKEGKYKPHKITRKNFAMKILEIFGFKITQQMMKDIMFVIYVVDGCCQLKQPSIM